MNGFVKNVPQKFDSISGCPTSEKKKNMQPVANIDYFTTLISMMYEGP